MQIDLIKKKPPTLTPYQVPYLPNPHCTYPSHHEQVKLSTTKEPNVEATNLKRRIQVFLIPPYGLKTSMHQIVPGMGILVVESLILISNNYKGSLLMT